jgi:hypothetical protein
MLCPSKQCAILQPATGPGVPDTGGQIRVSFLFQQPMSNAIGQVELDCDGRTDP